MVIERWNRIQEYASVLPHLQEALDCLAQNQAAAPGRYEFSGGFLLIQEGMTVPVETGDFEAHRKFLDVQILLEGAETMVWADLDTLTESTPYNEQADRSGHAGSGCPIPIRPGMFYICAPHDAHKACCHVETPTHFRKAVVKLRLGD